MIEIKEPFEINVGESKNIYGVATTLLSFTQLKIKCFINLSGDIEGKVEGWKPTIDFNIEWEDKEIFRISFDLCDILKKSVIDAKDSIEFNLVMAEGVIDSYEILYNNIKIFKKFIREELSRQKDEYSHEVNEYQRRIGRIEHQDY